LPSLLEALPKDNRRTFQKWLQRAVNTTPSDGQVPSSWKDISINLLNLYRVHADLTLTHVSPADDQDDESTVTATARLHNIRPDTQAKARHTGNIAALSALILQPSVHARRDRNGSRH